MEGVEGLHIAYNVFSEDFERRLFQGKYLYAAHSRQHMPGQVGDCAALMIERFPREVWEVSMHPILQACRSRPAPQMRRLASCSEAPWWPPPCRCQHA